MNENDQNALRGDLENVLVWLKRGELPVGSGKTLLAKELLKLGNGIPHPALELPGARSEFCESPAQLPDPEESCVPWIHQKLRAYSRSKREVYVDEPSAIVEPPEPPELTSEQEKHLFLRYNFARRQMRNTLRNLNRQRRSNRPITKEAIALGHCLDAVHTLREKIVLYYVPHVIFIPILTELRYQRGSKYVPSDLVSVGQEGLHLAIKRFDLRLEKPFTSLARTCVQYAIRNHIRKDRLKEVLGGDLLGENDEGATQGPMGAVAQPESADPETPTWVLEALKSAAAITPHSMQRNPGSNRTAPADSSDISLREGFPGAIARKLIRAASLNYAGRSNSEMVMPASASRADSPRCDEKFEQAEGSSEDLNVQHIPPNWRFAWKRRSSWRAPHGLTDQRETCVC